MPRDTATCPGLRLPVLATSRWRKCAWDARTSLAVCCHGSTAQISAAVSVQMRVKHLEYVVAHYERWVRQLKTQLGEREPFSSNSNFPLDP